MPLLLAVPFGMFLAWKRGDLKEAGHRPLACRRRCPRCRSRRGVFGGRREDRSCHPAGRMGLRGLGLGGALARANSCPCRWPRPRAGCSSMRRAQFAATLGHIGLAVAVIGVAGGSAWVSERLTVMKPGESADLAGYTITFKEVFERPGPNYAELAGAFELRAAAAASSARLSPRNAGTMRRRRQRNKRASPSGPGATFMSCSATRRRAAAFQIKMYYHPFVRWIWGGSAIMFIAGLLSLLDRRLRIGLPQGARKPSLAPAPAE